MSSYFALVYQADWAGGEITVDPNAVLIGVAGVVDERPYSAVIDERLFDAVQLESDTLVAQIGLPVYTAEIGDQLASAAVVDENVHPIAIVDESRYGAEVTLPGKPIAKVEEWPS